ncbi:hypothetical protein [Turneriella parva]|uniref:Uncharacterized protein n=1 Tax=Turneriella parva (strain ATCC BAA-1111 / DSM 21527 / NCTC 11395 / H) TaxID=869212 RepID=I4B0K2_TURPD|nr:hypothetical protein [Turneriella parva]AFM10809.1 hypothetical protein Turpa_0147 [Turneriella parva DSM 21527]
MNERVLAFLGAGIATTLLLLVSTYNEFKPTVETLIQAIGLVGALLAVYEFFRGK